MIALLCQLLMVCVLHYSQCSNINNFEEELLTTVFSSNFPFTSVNHGELFRERRDARKSEKPKTRKGNYKPIDKIASKPFKDKHGDIFTAHSAQHYRYLAFPLGKRSKTASRSKTKSKPSQTEMKNHTEISNHENSRPSMDIHKPFIDKNSDKVISHHALPILQVPLKRSDTNSNQIQDNTTHIKQAMSSSSSQQNTDIRLEEHEVMKNPLPSDGKRNLVQFRNSTGKVIATLHDQRNINNANVTLSKQDDAKRFSEELKSLNTVRQNIAKMYYLKKEKIPFVIKRGNKTNKEIDEQLVKSLDKNLKVLESSEKGNDHRLTELDKNDNKDRNNTKEIDIIENTTIKAEKGHEDSTKLTNGTSIEIIPVEDTVSLPTIIDNPTEYTDHSSDFGDVLPSDWKKILKPDDIADHFRFEKPSKNCENCAIKKPVESGENTLVNQKIRDDKEKSGHFIRHNIPSIQNQKAQKQNSRNQKPSLKRSSTKKRHHHKHHHRGKKNKQKNRKKKNSLKKKTNATQINMLKNQISIDKDNTVSLNSKSRKKGDGNEEMSKREISDIEDLMDDTIKFYEELNQLSEMEENNINTPKIISKRNQGE